MCITIDHHINYHQPPITIKQHHQQNNRHEQPSVTITNHHQLHHHVAEGPPRRPVDWSRPEVRGPALPGAPVAVGVSSHS